MGVPYAEIAGFMLILCGLAVFIKPIRESVFGTIGSFLKMKSTNALIVIGIVAVALGGLTVASGWIGGLHIASLMGGGSDASDVPSVSAATLAYCTYSAGATGATYGITVRADPNSNNQVIFDLKNTTYNDTSRAQTEMYANFTCVRAGQTDKAETVEIVAKGAKYYSEQNPTSTTQYNVASVSSSPSAVFSGDRKQTIYLKQAAQPASTDDQERTYLNFAEGVKSVTLGVMVEVDYAGYDQLNNYTSKTLTLSQRVGSSDQAIGSIVMNKIA